MFCSSKGHSETSKEVSSSGCCEGSEVSLWLLSQAAFSLLLFKQLEVSVGQDSCQCTEDSQRLRDRETETERLFRRTLMVDSTEQS